MLVVIKKNAQYLAIAWMVLLFILSVVPMNTEPTYNWFPLLGIDTVAHIVFHTVLVILWCLSWHHTQILKKRLVYAISMSFSFGLFIEFFQGAFLQGRYFENSDLIANIMGSFIGLALYYAYARYEL